MAPELVINELRGFSAQGGFQLSLLDPFKNRAILLLVKDKLGSTLEETKEYLTFLRDNDTTQYRALIHEAFMLFFRSLPERSFQEVPTLLTREEVSSLLSAPSSLSDQLFLELLYGCGLTLEEIQELMVNDIDLKQGMIHITTREDRLVPLPVKSIPKLMFHLRFLDPEQTHLFSHTQPQVQALLTLAGEAIDQDLTPELIRDSFIAHHLEHETDPTILKHLLGVTPLHPPLSHLVIKDIGSPLDF